MSQYSEKCIAFSNFNRTVKRLRNLSCDFGVFLSGHKYNTIIIIIITTTNTNCRSQWPRGLRRRSEAARLLRLWFWIPPGAWTFVCCECCVLSGRGLCNELITLPEESYRLWCVVVCDLETSRMRRPWPGLGRSATAKNIYIYISNTNCSWVVTRWQ
jgi:hypothetical protein